MGAGKPVVVTDSSFEAEVEKSETLVLVDFWAPWCGPCRMVGPVLEELAGENEGKLKVAKVNVDENPGLSQRFGIRSIPTIMFFKGGSEAESLIGVPPNVKDVLQEKINTLG
jgi:thioredoxin 1